VLSAPVTYAQAASANDIKELKKQIELLQASQKEMMKAISIIKDVATGKQPPLEDVFVSMKDARSEGDAKAKVIIVEFSDYQCPFCGKYANETYSKLYDDYVKPGKVKYVLRNFPLEQLHPNAEKAAEAAECAGEQGKYWEMHERLFKNQGLLDAKEMPGHALVLGMDQDKFKQCFEGGKFTAKVKADQAEGTKLQVTGTPSFFFGYADEKDPSKLKAVKKLSGAQPIAAFTDILDNLLNPAKEKDSE
jgi:protein-disulfide isomerase